MIDKLSITVLVDDTVHKRGLLGEHGLSFWIEADGRRMLFDTGQGRTICANAKALDVDLSTTRSVVLSHGHYDHTGGLAQVLRSVDELEIYAHPAAFKQKYVKREDGGVREVGIPALDRSLVPKRCRGLRMSHRPTSIASGIHVTGEIERRTDFEDTGGSFYLDAACEEMDPLLDDQALFFEVPEGIVLVLGCAHAGVVNTMRHVAALAGRDTIHAVLGGMHLLRASRERLEATAEAFARYDVKVISPAHCTGIKAEAYLWTRFPDRCIECTAGSRFTFGGNDGRNH